jgi:hypothetical protein
VFGHCLHPKIGPFLPILTVAAKLQEFQPTEGWQKMQIEIEYCGM